MTTVCICPACGRASEKDYAFCPWCGLSKNSAGSGSGTTKSFSESARYKQMQQKLNNLEKELNELCAEHQPK